MSFSVGVMALLAAYAVASIAYVYRWRGRTRYARFSQYLRKSWPVFAPLNCLLYMSTRRAARGPVVDAAVVEGLAQVRAQWEVIRDEALALHATGEIDRTSMPDSAGYHDLGFRTFYKRGWKKFYLSWYGPAHPSARRLCPSTVAIVEQVPGIRAAMFSLLPPGAELSLHADPLACSLRYHLGLATPNSAACHIVVDGHVLAWKDGEDFVFDETYPHHAVNGAHTHRLILMCDVERPMRLPGRVVNFFYSFVAKALAVPNTPEDRRGALTRAFAAIGPLRSAGVALKARHRGAYAALKLAVNSAGIALAASVLWLGLYAVRLGVSCLGTWP